MRFSDSGIERWEYRGNAVPILCRSEWPYKDKDGLAIVIQSIAGPPAERGKEECSRVHKGIEHSPVKRKEHLGLVCIF